MPITQARGSAQLTTGIDLPADHRLVAAAASTGHTANTVYLQKFRVSAPLPATKVTVLNGTVVAGNSDYAIYTWDGTQYVRQTSSGSIAAAGTSATQDFAFTAAVTPVPGTDYWLAFVSSDATHTQARISGVGAFHGLDNLVLQKAGVGLPLPATISTASLLASGYIPLVKLRV